MCTAIVDNTRTHKNINPFERLRSESKHDLNVKRRTKYIFRVCCYKNFFLFGLKDIGITINYD